MVVSNYGSVSYSSYWKSLFYETLNLIIAEVTWISGLILAIITFAFGVTGYSLPWDRIGYWACKIVTSVPETLDNLLPGVGKFLVLALRGGISVNQYTLTRLYSIHTFFLPLLTFILVIVHFLLIRKQGISGPL